MNKMAMTAAGLGVLYLMRNKKSRGKLMAQLHNLPGMNSTP